MDMAVGRVSLPVEFACAFLEDANRAAEPTYGRCGSYSGYPTTDYGDKPVRLQEPMPAECPDQVHRAHLLGREAYPPDICSQAENPIRRTWSGDTKCRQDILDQKVIFL
jgi:hypothetical protein